MAAYDIVALADVRNYLDKKSGDTADDTFLSSLITIASGSIERFIGGPVKEQTFSDEIYDGDGKDVLFLRNTPITSLKTPAVGDVQYRNAPDQNWLTLEATLAYILVKPDKPYALFLYANYFYEGQSNIKVSYKAGYTIIPDDIVRVCLEMIAIMFKESNQGEGRLGRSSVSTNSGGVSGTDSFVDLLERHKKVLTRYRKWKP
jgi:hypothetical protein